MYGVGQLTYVLKRDSGGQLSAAGELAVVMEDAHNLAPNAARIMEEIPEPRNLIHKPG